MKINKKDHDNNDDVDVEIKNRKNKLEKYEIIYCCNDCIKYCNNNLLELCQICHYNISRYRMDFEWIKLNLYT